MTTLTDTQVITASGGLVELGYSSKTSAVTVSSGYPGNDLGLSVTAVCDGSPVLVEFSSPSLNTGTTSGSGVGITLIMDGSDQAILGNLQNPGSGSLQSGCRFAYRMTPSAGSHTFTVKAYQGTSNGTVQAGSGGTGNYQPMWLRVSKIVQATQWPAVTTGTIICTSSTRPASPFEGQTIYETDTDLSYTWSGSAWVQTGNSTGTWIDYTPQLRQGTTNVNSTKTFGRYMVVGKTAFVAARVTASASGVSGQPVNISLPSALTSLVAAETTVTLGNAIFRDAGTAFYAGSAILGAVTSGVGYVYVTVTGRVDYVGTDPSFAIASGDDFGFSVTLPLA